MTLDKIFEKLLNWNLSSSNYKEILKEIQSIEEDINNNVNSKPILFNDYKLIIKKYQDQISKKEIENNDKIEYEFKVKEYCEDNNHTIFSAMTELKLPNIPNNDLEHKFWNDALDYIFENNHTFLSTFKKYHPKEKDLSKIKFKIKQL